MEFQAFPPGGDVKPSRVWLKENATNSGPKQADAFRPTPELPIVVCHLAYDSSSSYPAGVPISEVVSLIVRVPSFFS